MALADVRYLGRSLEKPGILSPYRWLEHRQRNMGPSNPKASEALSELQLKGKSLVHDAVQLIS